MITNPARRRRWFRFSLRMLIVVLTVLGMSLGYALPWIRERHALLATGSMACSGNGDRTAAFPLYLCGEKGMGEIDPPPDWPDTAVERVRGRFPEATVVRKTPLLTIPPSGR